MANIPMISVSAEENYTLKNPHQKFKLFYLAERRLRIPKKDLFFKRKVTSTPRSITKDSLSFQTCPVYCFPYRGSDSSQASCYMKKLFPDEVNHLSSENYCQQMCLLKIPQKWKSLCINLEIQIEDYLSIKENSLFPPPCLFSA